MADALTIDSLTKRFDGFVLDKVSLTLPPGRVMGFVGQNGAGKTTTIRLILNMAARDGGTVTILGMDNVADELAVKQEIGVVLDELPLVDAWKVRDVAKVIAPLYDRWDAGTHKDLLTRFDLPPDRPIKGLSRGMKLKLMLTVALSHDARLLILDEPTSGLDPVARDELLDVLREHVADGQHSVFFSTHITSDLEKIADDVTLIHRGRVFFAGQMQALLDGFVVVEGKTDALHDDLREHLVGLTTERHGFSGLLPTSHTDLVGQGTTAERPTIDDVLVYVAKEDRHHG